MAYQKIQVPDEGERITYEEGKLRVPDEPIIAFIEGDGTGPDIWAAAHRVLEAAVEAAYGDDRRIVWMEVFAGEKANRVYGEEIWLPDETVDAFEEFLVGIKGPLTTPVGGGIRSLNVALRKKLDLYACVRPCKTYQGVRTYFSDSNVDLVIVRENTEDLYAGVEFKAGEPKTAQLVKTINDLSAGKKIKTDAATTGVSIKPISMEGTRAIADYAFDFAVRYGRKSVTSVCKANIMKFTDGLWYDVTRSVALAYGAKFEWDEQAQGVRPADTLTGKPGSAGQVTYMERLIDNMCMQLVQKPEQYDVIVTENLYGDILSDLCAGLVGGLGVAPGANIGTEAAVFEATHGSAPKYKGQNKVNPTALMLSGVLMLRHLEEREAADRMEAAIAEVIRKGEKVTYDLKPTRDDPTAVGTSEFADAVIEELSK